MGVLLHWINQTVLNSWQVKTTRVRRWSKRVFSPPWKFGLRTKFSRKLDISSSIPIKCFIYCNISLLAGMTTNTAQRRTSERYFTRGYEQGRNDVRWRPGQEATLAPPCSNLRLFGSKCIHPHIDLSPGELFPPCPTRHVPGYEDLYRAP